MTKLRVKDVSSDSLFFHRCACGKLNILGFWHQLQSEFHEAKRLVIVTMPCRWCDKIKLEKFKLTTGRLRPRLLDWTKLAYVILNSSLLRGIAGYWKLRLFSWALWLDARVPI